jgi:hypothetical protein
LLRRDITYDNPFTEQKVTETHFFHISKADLVQMQLEEHNTTYEKDGETLEGMQAKLQRIVDSDDGKLILAEFKDIIRRSYGIKDGDKFRKSDEIWADFEASEAFSQLLFELCTDPAAASEFINGIVPHNLEQMAEEIQREVQKTQHAEALGTVEPATGTTQPADPLPPEPEGESKESEIIRDRAQEIANATPENPVTLTQAEVSAMDSDELKSGVATGKYRIN